MKRHRGHHRAIRTVYEQILVVHRQRFVHRTRVGGRELIVAQAGVYFETFDVFSVGSYFVLVDVYRVDAEYSVPFADFRQLGQVVEEDDFVFDAHRSKVVDLFQAFDAADADVFLLADFVGILWKKKINE